MIAGALIIGAREWLLPAALLGGVACCAVAVAYWLAPARTSVRWLAGALKVLGIAALVLCLVEPLLSEKRPRDGANLFTILVDNSLSLQMRDPGSRLSRAERISQWMADGTPWQTRLAQEFDVRRYAFDTRLRNLADHEDLSFDGARSSLGMALKTVAQRYHDRSMSGILLFSDGTATDSVEAMLRDQSLPPIYPVLAHDTGTVRDIRIEDVSVSQTNFEEAPVTIAADVKSRGYEGKKLIAQLCSEQGDVLETQEARCLEESKPTSFRFQFRPEASGVSFYELRVCADGDLDAFDDPGKTTEATLINNRRLVTVNRAKGPYRVLYVSGRPNWEFKFLRRAVEKDPEVELAGLIRIAKREAKFDFRGHTDESTNPLYRGFGNQADEQAEQYDEPVMMRLGTRDANELRGGFPRSSDELFAYHAIVLDDVEAAYFTRDQMSLMQQFVSQRGGGFMMLGGQESFHAGDYRHTPIDEIMPIYIDRPTVPAGDDQYRYVLTQEGLLQPWVRLRPTEEAEQLRLGIMPPFHTLNPLESIKPGATVLGFVRASSGTEYPALVTQRFGKGRTLAITIGDLWRWGLRRGDEEPRDLEKAWRQIVRWLVADVPKRLEIEIRPSENDPDRGVGFRIAARDTGYEPLDNASVTLDVVGPDGQTTRLTAEPSDQQAGVYEAGFTALAARCLSSGSRCQGSRRQRRGVTFNRLDRGARALRV